MSYSTVDQDGVSVNYIIQEHYSHEAYLTGLSNYYKRGKDLLQSRGWSLQEAILSKRVIHFTPSDIIWECKGVMKCLDENYQPDQSDWNIRNMLTKLERWSSTEGARQVAIKKVCTSLIKKYTLRTLSFQEDNLPAFGGIASYFSQFYGNVYRAGIWAFCLHTDLCWKVVETGQTRVRSLALEEPTAPSWSWASLPVGVGVDGPEYIGHREMQTGYQPQIFRPECQLSSAYAPFGRVDYGHLLIKAPIFQVQLSCVGLSPWHPDWIRYTILWGDDVKVPEESTVMFRHDTLLAVHSGRVTRATSGSQLEYLYNVSSFHGVAWVVWLRKLTDGYTEGLVLGRRSDSITFQRLGFVKMNNIRVGTFPENPSPARVTVS